MALAICFYPPKNVFKVESRSNDRGMCYVLYFARIWVFKKPFHFLRIPLIIGRKLTEKGFFADYIEYRAFENWINCIWLMCYSCRSTEVWSKRLIHFPATLETEDEKEYVEEFFLSLLLKWDELMSNRSWKQRWSMDLSFFYNHLFLFRVTDCWRLMRHSLVVQKK